MSTLIKQYGSAPRKHPCMEGMDAINITRLITLKKPNPQRQAELCHWLSQVIQQGMTFVRGTYENRSDRTPSNWCFWGPVITPGGERGEVIFVTKKNSRGERHHAVCFHGTPSLHLALQQCVLFSTIEVGRLNGKSISEGPAQVKESGRVVTRFSLTIEGNVQHGLHLLPKDPRHRKR